MNLSPEADIRTIICEGPCNPDLPSYDSARDRAIFSGSRAALRIIFEWGTKLQHTLHTRVKKAVWDDKIGWCDEYRCSICNHKRRF